MPLITPDIHEKEVNVTLKMPASTKQQIDDYVKHFKLNSANEFILKSIERIFQKDKDWKAYLKHRQTHHSSVDLS